MSIQVNTAAAVHIKKGEARALKAGGAWIYDNEVSEISGSYKNGDILSVLDFDGYPLGYGMINDNSVIRVRMLTRTRDLYADADEAGRGIADLLSARVKAAWDYRMTVIPADNRSAFRVIFGEADWLPGLVVDKYENILVAECLSLGMERLKKYVLTVLMECMKGSGYAADSIYERSDAPVRRKEGMQPFKGLIYHKGDWLSQDKLDAQSSSGGRASTADALGFSPCTDILENGIRYHVDVENGQKTGFFLDQKFNRLAMQRLCTGLIKRCFASADMTSDGGAVKDADASQGGAVTGVRVLDCFTHMGTFALNCGLAMKNALDQASSPAVESAPVTSQSPAEDTVRTIADITGLWTADATGLHTARNCPLPLPEVTGLDISEFAVSQASANASANGLSDIVHFRAANVLDELPKLYEAGEKYDVVILDPPAFTKSREATKNAIKGYREINMKGLKLIKDGGYLATCSCSHFMTQELFTEVIGQAAKAVHKRLRQVEFNTQGPDHPILWSADESYYLKFLIFQVCEEK